MCAGFPAGSGNAHRFVNKTDKDVVLLVVGDRTPFDEVTYPDIDLHGKAGADAGSCSRRGRNAALRRERAERHSEISGTRL